MPDDASPQYGGTYIPLLTAAQGAVTTAQTATTPGYGGAAGRTGQLGMNYLALQAKFVYVASAATSAKAWVQTSFDKGATWIDIANFAFTTATLTKVAGLSTHIVAVHATPTDATLADNTVINGLLGDRIRVKFTSVGTYGAGTSLTIDAWARV